MYNSHAGLGSVAASLGELGRAAGALERVTALLDDPSPAAVSSARSSADRVTDGSSGAVSSAQPAHSRSQAEPSTSAAEIPSLTLSPAPPTRPSSPSGRATLPSLRGAVSFRGVSFRYAGRTRWAVWDLTLDVEPGSTTALVGPSGSGKSSIANLLMGLYTPTEGRACGLGPGRAVPL